MLIKDLAMNNTLRIVNDLPNRHIWEYEMPTYLKDSNAYGNIYFARYFEWQGVCREMWFSECIFPNMFELKGALVTHNAYNNYVAPVYPFEKIRCELTTLNIKSASFQLHFAFYNSQTGNLVSEGGQKIAIIDSENGRLIRFPKEILDKVRYYEK